MAAPNHARCSGCGGIIPTYDKRVVVKAQNDAYHGGRVIGRFCEKCWPHQTPKRDGRFRQPRIAAPA